MRKFIAKIGLFFVLMVIIDFAVGIGMRYTTARIAQGGVARDNYICNTVADDVLIFGSSRAEHHYNAQMISDSLGLSCYNCGESGCGIILAYGRLLMLLERHKPKVVIYEITPGYDYLLGGDNHKFLYRLKQHYERKGIDSIFWNVDATERFKMLSWMYRYNSSFLQNIVAAYLHISTDTGIKGFRPMVTPFDSLKVRDIQTFYEDEDSFQYDPLKMSYFNRFLDKTAAIKTFFVASPIWYGMNTAVFKPIKEICEQRNIPFLDFSNDPKYVHNSTYFADGNHLNAVGADEFTRDLIHKLKKLECPR